MNYKLSVSIIVVWIISGCVNNPSFQPLEGVTPETVSLPSTSSAITTKFHVVSKGETLYSIALLYDLDYRLLASENNVNQQYKIVPGQRLKLDVTKPQAMPSSVTSQTLVKTNTDNAISRETTESHTFKKSLIQLNWPVDKTIVRTSGVIVPQLKGIDIRSQIGDSVLAAADGEIVFAGSGLRGYGNLIIIQHTDDILTAYAYTKEIFVKEKQIVQAGDRIATVGTKGSIKDAALHFEVRKNGKPLDPLAYLPK